MPSSLRAPVIPDVPQQTPAYLRDFLRALRQYVMTREGQYGSAGRGITLQDIDQSGRVTISANAPDPPTNLVVMAGNFQNTLTWTEPAGDYSHIEIYCNTLNRVSSAQLIGIVTRPVATYIDDIPFSEASNDHYYWIRSVNFAGLYSDWVPRPNQGGAVILGTETVASAISDTTEYLKGIPQGVYDAGTVYAANDRVSWTGADGVTRSYKRLDYDIGASGVAPSNATYWEQIGLIVTGTIDGAPTVGIDGNLVVDGTILAHHIGADQITAEHIEAGTITATEIAADTITATEIAAGTITSTEIAADTITAGNIAAATITAAEIAAATITGDKIAAATIEASNIKAGTITATEIAASTITGAKIAAGTIESTNIKASTITTANLSFAVIDPTYISSGKHKLSSIADDGGTLTISSSKLRINAAEGVEINTAGGMLVTGSGGIDIDEGGDIILYNETNANPAKITWKDDINTNSYSFYTQNGTSYSELRLEATGLTDSAFYVQNFDVLTLYGRESIALVANGSDYGEFYLTDGAARPGWHIYAENITGTIFTVDSDTANDLFKVTNTGEATIVGQFRQDDADAFQAKMSANQNNLTASTWATVAFNSETNDHTSAFNTSTYTYTAQGSGWRQFNVSLYVSGFGSGEVAEVQLVTSNETFSLGSIEITGSYGQLVKSQLAYMDNGDTAYVRIYPTTAGNTVDVLSAGSHFSGFYVND